MGGRGRESFGSAGQAIKLAAASLFVFVSAVATSQSLQSNTHVPERGAVIFLKVSKHGLAYVLATEVNIHGLLRDALVPPARRYFKVVICVLDVLSTG